MRLAGLPAVDTHVTHVPNIIIFILDETVLEYYGYTVTLLNSHIHFDQLYSSMMAVVLPVRGHTSQLTYTPRSAVLEYNGRSSQRYQCFKYTYPLVESKISTSKYSVLNSLPGSSHTKSFVHKGHRAFVYAGPR
jgi:hypothetical protein